MDRLAYEKMYEIEANHWWYKARRGIISTTISRMISLPREASILEAGCGAGGNLELLSQFGTVDAFEYDEVTRENAIEKSKIPVKYGALPKDIPFGDKKYDLIGIFDVLEHIEDDKATLENLGARLNNDGRILITVPALQWLWSSHDVRNHHFRRYSRTSLTQVAEAAGLVVEKSFYFNSFLLPVAVSLRITKNLLGKDTPEDTMPAAWLNKILHTVFSSEIFFVNRVNFPIGLSVCAVLKRGTSECSSN